MINQNYLIICCILSLIPRVNAEEYVYPVAFCTQDNQQHIYLLYQKSIRHIELWVLDPSTKIVNKALLSSFTPAGLRILPDESGFSFIDNGRIKIKQFCKRSPKSLDIYEPIYDIGVVEWSTPTQCYFSAKENGSSNIYALNMRAELTKIVGSSDKCVDCLYPQKVGDQLFYIERTECSGGHRFAIMQTSYPEISYDQTNFNDVNNFDAKVKVMLAQQAMNEPSDNCQPIKKLICDWEDQALAFLCMVSPHEGFVLEHPSKIDKQDKTIILSYYRILMESDKWHRSYLFSFEVPLHLLLPDSASRLYESMLPLLPRHIGDYIYFVDCSRHTENFNLTMYIYHLEDGKITQLANAYEIGQDFFAPIQIDNTLLYGGSILPDSEIAPCMRINQDGCMCCELPRIRKEASAKQVVAINPKPNLPHLKLL